MTLRLLGICLAAALHCGVAAPITATRDSEVARSHTATARDAFVGLGQSASCDECVMIVAVVQNITENATTLAEVIAAFDGAWRQRRS